MKFPTWARHDEDYHPSRDRDAFLSRSLLRVMDILFSLRAQGRRTSRIPALGALLLLFAWILFIVLAQTTTLLFIATAVALAVLAVFSGRAIRRVLGGAFAAALFSLLLVLPAFFLSAGGWRALLLPWKSFLTMAGVMMLAESLMWHDVTRALARLHVPETVIFLLDTMLRSLYMLGVEAGRLLLALKLRSIGRNRQKSRAMGGRPQPPEKPRDGRRARQPLPPGRPPLAGNVRSHALPRLHRHVWPPTRPSGFFF